MPTHKIGDMLLDGWGNYGIIVDVDQRQDIILYRVNWNRVDSKSELCKTAEISYFKRNFERLNLDAVQDR